MRAISFGWTADAILAGRKTVTRRDWKPHYAESFRAGDELWALDKVYFAGGKRIAVIELTEAPYLENTADIPATDWEAEGFAYLNGRGIRVDGYSPRAFWAQWKADRVDLWVIRFRILFLTSETSPTVNVSLHT